MGLTPLETVRLAFNDVSEKEGLKYFDICFEYEIKYLASHPGKLYPSEFEVLSLLSKTYPLYIVSNADKGYIGVGYEKFKIVGNTKTKIYEGK